MAASPVKHRSLRDWRDHPTSVGAPALGHFGLIGMAAFLLELAWGHRRRANLAGVICFTWAAQFVSAERRRYDSFAAFVRGSCRNLFQFLHKLALALIFPLTIFAALAATRQLTFPVLGLHRYDLLLLLCVGVQLLLLIARLESPSELKVITWFHILGLTLELFKVRAGSWSYPEPAWTKFGGVPLFSGFMYASVASFLIQVWHRLDLQMERWPHRLLVMPLGVAIYLNFFTHHFVADLRWFLMLAVALLFFRTRMVATNTDKPRTIPLVGTFAGLGFFIAWFLLSIISFLLVAQLKLRTMRTEPSPPSP